MPKWEEIPKFKVFLLKICIFFFVFTLTFPVRHIFFNYLSYILGEYSDFTSFSLYLSDIMLVVLFFTTWWTFLPRGREIYDSIKYYIPLYLCGILTFFIKFDHNWPLSLYFLVKLGELIVAYGTFHILFTKISLKHWFFKVFNAFATTEALIALIQFAKQGPLGLNKLGEQLIYPNALGVAKIIIAGKTYIRAYGTFPHPNLLSAFLIVGIFASIYLFYQIDNKIAKICYAICLFINIFGLTVTFSRGAFLAFGIGLVVFFGYLIIKRQKIPNFNQVVIVMVIVIVSALGSLSTFKPFLLTRATISDQATVERKLYNHIALKMILNHPITGIGAGESVLHMQQYSPINLTSWQTQPIHNYFLLATAELGIVTAVILIWIILWHGWVLLKSFIYRSQPLIQIKNGSDALYTLTLFSLLICFLVLMQFDHYFYTLQQTQFLFWIVLGIIAAAILNPSPKIEEGQGL
ncbi:MAG: O-antigen ligase family protein [Patescibacteria group bacterium]|nr:O-antigen ligase family protein [Patescibacteria group bacterium]